MHGVSPTVISRTTRRAAAASELTGAAPEEPVESGADAERVEPKFLPLRQHVEREFPDGVGDSEPDEAQLDDFTGEAVVRPSERPPDRAPGQHKRSNLHPLEYAEHRLKCTRQDIAHLRTIDRPEKLAAAEEKERELVEWLAKWTDAYRGLDFGRPQNWVPMHTQVLDDRPPRALWDNPYDSGPRGFTVVGS
jgi:hypothetical protein